MATGGQGYGYPLQIFTTNGIDSMLHICGICDMVLKEPFQTPCGHRFCKGCILTLIVGTCCPQCLTEEGTANPILFYQVNPDNGKVREMNPLRTRCTKCNGWAGSFKQLEIHWKNCQNPLLPDHVPLAFLIPETTDTRVARLEQQVQELQPYKTRSERLERTVHLQEVALAEINAQIESGEPSNDGTLLWKISNYHQKKQAAIDGREIRIYSRDFFTSPHGYRLKGCIYLNGEGIGKGTHLSVFVVVCRGKYDDLLSWPFQQPVAFQLVKRDQQNNTKAILPDLNGRASERPTTDQNVGSGLSNFATQQMVEQSFVRDDTLFVYYEVNINGLQDPVETIYRRN